MIKREPMPIDKTKPVIRWAVIRDDKQTFLLVEVEDTMRCIERPGDCGWVSPVDKTSGIHRWIADFHWVFESREAAKVGCIAIIQERIEKAHQDLRDIRGWKTEHCHMCGALNLDGGECSNTACVRY